MPEKGSLSLWFVAGLVLVVGTLAFLATKQRGHPQGQPASVPTVGVAETTKEVEPEESSSFDDRLEALRSQAERLQLSAPEEQLEAARRSFVNDARTLGDEAIEAKRTDRVAEIGRILMDGGEGRFAEAFLQRCMGLLKPAAAGKDHIYPLAQLRRADGRALEAASLYERAIDVEPTTAAEYVGLSDLYLAADRMGPARAAVSRGLRKHGGSTLLAVQGAKVALLDGKAQEGLDVAVELLKAEPEDVAAQLVQIEALLALGKISEANAASSALRDEFPADAWGWIFGGVIAAAQGKAQLALEMLDQATELAGDCACTHEERLAIAWAARLKSGEQVAPRSRAEDQKQPKGTAKSLTKVPQETSPELR